MSEKKTEDDDVEVGMMRKDERTSRFFISRDGASPNRLLAGPPPQLNEVSLNGPWSKQCNDRAILGLKYDVFVTW